MAGLTTWSCAARTAPARPLAGPPRVCRHHQGRRAGGAVGTPPVSAVRLGPDDDDIAVTAAQVRDVITRLTGAGHGGEGDPHVLVIFDAGYDVTRLAYLLADLPAQVLGRLRSDRVMQLSAPPRQPHTRGGPASTAGNWPWPTR
jgi:DDE superfamily endonuclease